MKPYSILLVIICFQLVCCKNAGNPATSPENDEWTSLATKTVNYWEGRTMILPNSLPHINGGSDSLTGSSKFKMVTYVDGTCSTCVDNLSQWTKFMKDVNQNGEKCRFIFYINTDDPKVFQKTAMDKTGFKADWYQDKKRQFIKTNNLYDLRFQTALLDSTDHVILIGSMSFRPQLEELYKKTLKQLNSELIVSQ